jgi:hypothetical protein
MPAESERKGKGKVGCADAAPKPSTQVSRRRREPCARKRARTVRERGVRATQQWATGPYSTISGVIWLEIHLVVYDFPSS